MKATTPRPLIGIAAPSDNMATSVPLVEQALVQFQQAGLEAKMAENLMLEYGRFAGDHRVRAEHFMRMAADRSLNVLQMAGGGYGCLHMLPYLDFTAMRKDLVWVGFSDSGVVLNARVARTGVGGWHGIMFRQLAKGFEGADRQAVLNILQGTPPRGYGAEVLGGVTVINPGTVRGRLLGGNLGGFRSMMGTPWAPKPQEGDILFLEELDDDLCRVDRDLYHLANAGWFEKLGGLIYGSFSEMHESTSRPFGFSLDEVFTSHAKKVNGPVVANFPVGHAGLNMPLPVGSTVVLTAGDSVSLEFEGVR